MSIQVKAHAAGDGRLRRRIQLVAFVSVSVFLLAASAAWACTTYWGQITIENITTDSGEFTVVADPTSGMDRCDDADNDGDQDGEYGSSASDDDNVIDAADGDVVRVEISMWEPGSQDDAEDPDSWNDCEAADDVDGDGVNDHSLASPGATDDTGVPPGSDPQPEPVYINSLDGTAYDDKDGDGSYEDYDDGAAGNETNGDSTTERVADCMGDGSDTNETNYDPDAGTSSDDGDSSIAIIDDGSQKTGQFSGTEAEVTHNGSADADNDGVNDVDITFSTSESSGTPQALCVSEDDGGDSAPQIPIETT